MLPVPYLQVDTLGELLGGLGLFQLLPTDGHLVLKLLLRKVPQGTLALFGLDRLLDHLDLLLHRHQFRLTHQHNKPRRLS